jgi:TonB family protein
MSSAVAFKTWAGRTVDGKFPLGQWLGGSDHSAVFLTERQGEPRKAAIKIVADATDSAHQLWRWHCAAQLSHPHLIGIFEAGRCQLDGTRLLYVLMEYAEEDLSQILPQRPLTPAEAADMLPPLLDGLSYLHQTGFVHGSIRPSNVLAVDNQLKLASDQLVPVSDAASARRRRDVYDAPETAAGVFTPAGDMWSVGATLVAALTQSAHFSADGMQGDPGVPTTIPEPFRGIARECLHLDPKRRSSIAEITARLQPAARSVPAQTEQPAPPPRSFGRAPITIAILVVALLVGLIAFLSRGKSVPSQSSSTAEQSAPEQPAPATTPASISKIGAASTSVTPPRTHQISKGPVAAGGGIVRQVVPDVPQSARNTITGRIRVVVRVDVDPAGKVSAARLSSAGPSKYFANLALKAAQRWEFAAPQVNGQPTASAWILRFRFGRRGTEISPERVTR